jgi:hypothetical protein
MLNHRPDDTLILLLKACGDGIEVLQDDSAIDAWSLEDTDVLDRVVATDTEYRDSSMISQCAKLASHIAHHSTIGGQTANRPTFP